MLGWLFWGGVPAPVEPFDQSVDGNDDTAHHDHRSSEEPGKPVGECTSDAERSQGNDQGEPEQKEDDAKQKNVSLDALLFRQLNLHEELLVALRHGLVGKDQRWCIFIETGKKVNNRLPMKKATFGAGCFWGVEALFRKVPGVVEVVSGYTGGTLVNPTYEDVCNSETGHAEAVEVTYDPEKVSYERLLEVFWMNHNPTTPNQQGPDHGSQYRSVIFYHDEEQKRLAEASKEAVGQSGKWQRPIVTEIAPAETFYRAEEYHQRYFEKLGIEPTCHL